MMFLPSFFGYESMEVISQEISAIHASMPIKYSKISWFLPICSMLRLAKIEYYSNSVLIVLSDRSLISWCRISSNGAMSIFRMFSRLEVGDSHEHFRQHRMVILMSLDASLLEMEGFRLYENLLSDNLINLFDGWFGFGSRLVLIVIIFDGWSFS